MTHAPTARLPLRQRLVQERRRVWVVGHRGAMGHRPENTIASFEHALELGADWIELDVHLSRDGALVVIHDESLERTTTGHGLVKDHTLDELKQLDAGGWFAAAYTGQHIPTLDEVLEWARQRGTILDIEIKNVPIYYAGIEEAVVKALDSQSMAEQVIVISFDHRCVKRVKSLDARIATGVLYAGRPTDAGVGLARQADADALLPHWAYVTPEDVRTAHAAGLAVAPWATSNPEVLAHLLEADVDAIATNHPEVLRHILAHPTATGPNRATTSTRTVATQPSAAGLDRTGASASNGSPVLEGGSGDAVRAAGAMR